MELKKYQNFIEILKSETTHLLVQLKRNFWYFLVATLSLFGVTIFFKPVFLKLDFLVVIPSKMLDIFICVVSFVILVKHVSWASKDYVLSRLYEFFLLVIVIVYLIYRLIFKGYWSFSWFDFNERIFYMDFLLGSLFVGILILRNKRLLKKVSIKSGSKDIVPLITFSSMHDDSFMRGKSASDFIDIILQSEDKNAIAVGIVGPWGVGKSWYMEKMEEIVEGKYASTHEVIKLNPWKSSTDQNIIVEFLNTLKDKLAIGNGNFNRLVDSYIRSVTKVDKTSSLSTFVSSLASLDMEGDEFGKIQFELNRSNKKFVVFIDDIDRLGDDEVMEVLRLIRNTGNFKGLYYIVGYDKSHLLKAISENFKYKHEKFLDKIFQIEKELSIIPSYLLKNEFIEQFEKFKDSNIITSNDSIEINNQSFVIINGLKGIGQASYLATIFDIAIKNKRELIKLINSFKIKVVYLKNERIDLVQLLVLDILNLVDYANYSLLQDTSRSSIKKSGNLYANTILKDSVLGIEKPDDISFEYWILSKKELGIGDKLIKILFHKTEEDNKFGKIYNPQYFNSFFEFSGGVTAAIFVREFLESKDFVLDSSIKKYEENGQLNELIKIIKDEGLNIIPEEIDKYERFIWIVDALSIKSGESLLNSGYFDGSILDVLYQEKNLQRWGFIKRVSTEVNAFSKYLLWEVLVQELHLSSNPFKELEAFLLKLNDDNYERLQNGDKWKKALINQIEKHNLQDKMIESVYEVDNSEYIYSINELYKMLFNGYERLADFIDQFDDSISKLEFATFFRRYKHNNFAPIKFKRGTVEINSSSETLFYGSDKYNIQTEPQNSTEFKHIHFQERIESENTLFIGVPWIAKDAVINNRDEQFNGDTYYFKREFKIDRLDCLDSITLQFFVDDLLIDATLNGEQLFENVETGSHLLAIKSFVKSEFIKDENKLEFKISNYPLSKVGPGRAYEEIKPGENPYGIIYILELNYDFEKLNKDKNYELW